LEALVVGVTQRNRGLVVDGGFVPVECQPESGQRFFGCVNRGAAVDVVDDDLDVVHVCEKAGLGVQTLQCLHRLSQPGV
jgi:hypothetical protein